jgi:ABC-type antimicrobial peptide transport system permease subunit
MFFSVIAECVVIAAAGCLVPALRALRLDPVAAMRLN